MKAIVLAGGYATRLWPVTKHRPKMLLPVGDSTVIDRILADLESDDRITDVFVSTNERFADDFKDHLAASSYQNVSLTVEETNEEDEKFGVVGALAQLVDREGLGDEDLLVVAGDNLISFDISAFIDHFEQYGDPTLAAYDVGSLEKAKSYGLIETEGDEVVDFQEKPDNPKSTLVSIACYAFPADAIRFEEYLSEGNNPDEPGWFIQWLVGNGTVRSFTFDEAWYDIGTPESYLEAVGWELEGENVVAEDATIENTTLGDNVHVLSGAEVVNSSLDNTVVFPNATIVDADIRNSIIDKDTHIESLDLAGALIGAHTQLTNGG
ncbi:MULTISPECIES: sugar phosphate nucleotidyltransferase [Haloarcula]|uniref:Glucose-1-phosphate thymidylyltransferase n=1 Tax=Haloarcula pellucida TaxID=1427151 RepID=A0A830GGW8_9EURY|nr:MULTISPECIES: NDP-sugar synthase [Halomicroarcula]MBX0346889.1 NDP-sugar synthase [Halomicroarcula pellucida]MDS0277237.1 NDP-sugar synthase [Halomicroarcula sp. S1AR25-4]GGN85958.1 glucose-1-phosphate thymidylyltransferase [Halomicroarcula pellucida]